MSKHPSILKSPAGQATCTVTVAILLTLTTTPAGAWQINGSPVCNAPVTQNSPAIVPDGSGGVIIVWQDQRGGTFLDVYAQRLTATGELAPSWPVNGLAVCTASQDQSHPTVIGDGAGGAIITWEDLRSFTTYDIYAQHVLPSGAIDPIWPATGIPICTASNDQGFPQIVSDGAGGAIIAWTDARAGVSNRDIYAQHVKSTGVVDPTWPADGRALCTAATDQEMMRLASDGAGGAIATWVDSRDAGYDIYAQRVLASGAVDPAWPSNGVAVCVADFGQFYPAIVADGAGGAVITWEDVRGVFWHPYAQHVLSSGTTDPAWPANGRALSLAVGDQRKPQIASDGGGGAIAVWYDFRGADSDIYAQHVLANGTLDPSSPSDGAAVCVAANTQSFPQVVADGSGGALVTWQDLRGGSAFDVYASRLLSTSVPNPAWPANGAVLCQAANYQNEQVIASDGSGGAIVAWADSRASEIDIYAQHVMAASGGVASVPGDAPLTGIEMLSPFPNPAHGKSIGIPLVLPAPSQASIEIFDAAGHRVRALLLDHDLTRGQHLFEWDGRNDALEQQPAGVYLVRVRTGTATMTRKMILLQ